jgi:hypothetical protein
LRIPSNKKIGVFAAETLAACQASKVPRQQRGAIFRNLFLTGDESGNPQTYAEVNAFIDNLSSFLYSPVELRFSVSCYGSANTLDRAKMKAATSDFHMRFRGSNTDTLLDDATTWALVKGKTFIKNTWTNEGFKDYLIQPEVMGVLEENLRSLDDQDAFSHTIYVTPDRLYRLLKTNPNRNELMRKAMRYAVKGQGSDDPERENSLRQIVVGGLYPYQQSGTGNSQGSGQVNWLEAPTPTFAPEVIADMIPLHELWVWDDERDNEKEGLDGEYTTIQFVGEDVVIAGELTHRNLFADQFSPGDRRKKLEPTSHNPLSGHHPFSEICPNQLDGYFWGRSELCNVALLQKCINLRVDGINQLLRKQEDPPKFFSGVAGIKQSAYSIIKKAGGYLTDSNPGAKVMDLAPSLPDKLFESLHEFQAMFDRMAGFTDTMSGRGSPGVRSKEHAQALTSNASPRFKDRALALERQIEAIGSLKLDMLKAHVPDSITAWVPKKEAGIEGEIPSQDWLEQPPVPGTVPIEFTYYDLPDNCKVTVDSHSSSPAFSHETKQDLFDLVKIGGIDAEQVLEHLHPPGADEMIEALQRRKAEQAAFQAAHPELAEQESSKKKKK